VGDNVRRPQSNGDTPFEWHAGAVRILAVVSKTALKTPRSASGLDWTVPRISSVRSGSLGSMMNSVACGREIMLLYFCRSLVRENLIVSPALRNQTAVTWGVPSVPTVDSDATTGAAARLRWESGINIILCLKRVTPRVAMSSGSRV